MTNRSSAQTTALIGLVGLLTVWLVSVAIRSWHHEPIDFVVEGTVVGSVAGGLYTRISGRRSGGDGDES